MYNGGIEYGRVRIRVQNTIKGEIMKNGIFKKILSLTLVVLMILSAVLATGCAKKDKDKDKDEITLEAIKGKAEDAGYEVEEADDSLLSMMNMSLEYAEIDGKITAAIDVVKETDDDYLYADVYEFDSESAAKGFVDIYKDLAGELDEDQVIKRSGKVVIVGDKATVEAIW